jgi:hypothetical protein
MSDKLPSREEVVKQIKLGFNEGDIMPILEGGKAWIR